MSHLLKNIIQRHIHPQNTVLPRLQGNLENPVRNQPDMAVEMPFSEGPNNTFSGTGMTPGAMSVGIKTAFDPALQDQKSASGVHSETAHFGATVPQKQQTDVPIGALQEPVHPKADGRLMEHSTQVFPKTAITRPQDMQERMQAAIALATALKPANQNDSPRAFTPDFHTGFSKWQQTSDTTKLPVVKIHIGRIEIKAIKENPQQQRKAPERPKPAMSLDQYLKERTKP